MAKIVSKFENLPNELLLDVFSYCRPRDLYISLLNLNQRLNDLIGVQLISIDLGNSMPKHLLDLYYKSVLSKAQEKIYTLRLSDSYGRLNRFITDVQQIELDLDTRKSILNQIKSLILWDPLMNSLYEILNYATNIEFFQVTSIGRARKTPNYSVGLLKCLFQMEKLKRVSLALHDSISFSDEIGISQSITHLNLNGCHMQHLSGILRRIPKIQRLAVMCYNRPNLFSITRETFDRSIYDGIGNFVPNLTHLVLHVTHTPFYEIALLLQQLTKLVSLSFSSLLIEDYGDGANWEKLLSVSHRNLEKFSLYINESHIHTQSSIDKNAILQSFSGKFWQKWPVVVEHCTESNSRQHLMIYTVPTQRDNVRTFLYNVETVSSFDLFEELEENHKNFYKKLHEIHFTIHSNNCLNKILPLRIYPNLRSLSFTSELLSGNLYSSERFWDDLVRICSKAMLNNVKRIYLYNPIYPKEFLSDLLKNLPNVQSIRCCTSLLKISTVHTRVTSLTVEFDSQENYKIYDVLQTIGNFLPNVHYLYVEINNLSELYVVLIYFLRKLVHLFDLHVTLNDPNLQFDQTSFLLWLEEFKAFNSLNSRVQVEFGHENNRLHISL